MIRPGRGRRREQRALNLKEPAEIDAVGIPRSKNM